jgi:hypothetical protein
MHGKTLGLALLATVALPVQAATFNAPYMTAASGTLTIYDPVEDLTVPATSWVNTSDPAANLVGSYVELGEVSYFFGLPMFIYTGNGSMQPYGGFNQAPGGPIPTALLDNVAHTIQVDLSAFTWFWNEQNYNQGDANVVGTWNPVTGVYHIAWDSPFIGFAFDGLVGQWTMTGVAAIPEPGTYAQMLAALVLMAPLMRRRRPS